MIKPWDNIKIYNSTLIGLTIALLTVFFSFPFISYDGGYYLSVIREMYNGQVYFKDIASPYNPLALILLGLPYKLMTSPSFAMHLAINVGAILGSAFVLYKTIKLLFPQKSIALLLALLFVATTLNFDGNLIMLEPVSVLFQLIGCYCYLKVRPQKNQYHMWFLFGCFTGFAFLAKQFALFILLPVGIDLILQRKQFIQKCVIMGLGLVFPILLFYLYYASLGTSLQEFMSYILGKSVALDQGVGTGLIDKVNTTNLINFLIAHIFVLWVPFLLRNTPLKQQLFFILLAIAPCSVLLFATYDHYFQYISPYFMLLFAFALSQHKMGELKLKLPFNASIIIAMGMLIFLGFKSGNRQIQDHTMQQTAATIIKNNIPEKVAVYFCRLSPAYYYLGNYQSIQLNKIGFIYPEYFFPETVLNVIQSDAYLVLTDDYVEKYNAHSHLFEKHTIQLNNQNVYIYKKK